MRRLRALLVIFLVSLALVACSSSDDSDDSSDSDTGEITTTTDAEETSTTEASTTTDDPSDDDDSEPEELPGEPIDLFPHEGDELAVVGVDRDDVLNLRDGPGPEFETLVELDPIATGLTATGENRDVEEGIWAEVEFEGTTGWVSVAYAMQLGEGEDVTDEIDSIAGETMIDIAEQVGESRSEAGGEVQSRIAVIEDPEVGDLGSVLVDVIGFADDSVAGERLHILAEPAEGDEGFTVSSVERIPICARGVSDEGLCA